jgi:4-aminobutyrate--pyruvate transaminase
VPGRARRLGAELAAGLETSVASHFLVGEVRTRGFMAGIELVADRTSRAPFPPALRIGAQVERRCRAHGVMIRNMGDALAICPPFILESADVGQIVDGVRSALDDVAADLAQRDAA